MKLLALAAFIVVPTGEPAATVHEKVLPTHAAPVAATKLPESIWHLEGDDARHLQSTLVCPAAVGDFQRNQLVPFDNYGFDVACGYTMSGSSVVTLYLTRRVSRSLADDFADAQVALKQRMPEATPINAVAPTGANFTSALYTRGDGTRTGLWVADIAGWTFKFRATYEDGRESDTLAAMSALTAKMSGSAGSHLAACAAAPPAQRGGRAITDKEKNNQLALIAVIGFAAADDEKGATVPTQWCAEEPAGDEEIPMLFWRDIAGDGTSDRISLMTMGPPPMLHAADNEMLPSILDDGTKQVYQLTGMQGAVGFVFAFFDGRPAGTVLSPIAKDIFQGKRKPLAAYDTKANSIIISVDAAKPGGTSAKLSVRHGDIPPPFQNSRK